MKLVWVTVEDYKPTQPEAIDTTSSLTTVYINKNVKRATKKDPMTGESIAYWQCDRATLSVEEYGTYLEMQQLYTMPEFEALKNQVTEQQLAMAEIAVNTEYSVCLQEMSAM